MSETLVRQWMMLKMLPRAPRRIDTGSIQDHLRTEGFEVSLRTIQRDLQSLSVVFPLECDERDKPFGWYWMRDAESYDLPGMDSQTALTFRLVEDFLANLLPRHTLNHLTPHFKKANNVLDNLQRKNLKDWLKKVYIVPRGQPLTPTEVSDTVLDVVYEAMLEDKQFHAVYHPRRYKSEGKKETVEYNVSPLGLVFRNAVICLVCTINEYQDIRQLALQRVGEATLLDDPVKPSDDFDLEEYVQQGKFGVTLSESKIKIDLLFQKDAAIHLSETPIDKSQKLKEKDGKVRVKATIPNTQELRWWILGFGNNVEVIGPPDLRQEIQQIISDMHTIYNPSMA